MAAIKPGDLVICRMPCVPDDRLYRVERFRVVLSSLDKPKSSITCDMGLIAKAELFGFRRKTYARVGYCSKCGDCCRTKYLEAHIEAAKIAGVKFTYIRSCDKFDEETGRCGDYENRPDRCRVFPGMPWEPKIFPNCTYKFVEVKEDGENRLLQHEI